MQIFEIRKWAFYGISILILALPLSRNWRLIVNGKKVPGTVYDYTPLLHEKKYGEPTIEYASEIRFQAEGIPLKTYGPLNHEYKQGRIVNVLYDPEDPSKNCILTFTGIYLNSYSILPLVLFVLWGAFYLSLYNYSNPAAKRRKSDLV